MENEIRAIFMIEMLGKPAEHVEEKMQDTVKKLSEESNLEVVDKKVAKPKQVKDEENVFSSFAEVEFKTSLKKIMGLVFAYMPSNVEIVTPERIVTNNSDMSAVLNLLTQKLHKYDEFAKAVMMERKQLAKKIKSNNSEKEEED